MEKRNIFCLWSFDSGNSQYLQKGFDTNLLTSLANVSNAFMQFLGKKLAGSNNLMA